MDLRALMFLHLDNGHLASVIDLFSYDIFKSNGERIIFDIFMEYSHLKKDEKVFLDMFFTSCLARGLSESDIDYFMDTLCEVLDDYAECAPHLGEDGSLPEHALIIKARSEHICNVCGDRISRGENAYIRTSPVDAVRHEKCNNSIRYSHEYAYIYHHLKEIEWYEKLFINQENKEYCLKDDSGLRHRAFYKKGFIADKNGVITRIPGFGKFVIDYLGGEDDYELIKKYRPYNLYLEFFLKMKGLSNIDIQQMGGMKYLLREDISKETHPAIRKSIENTAYSELMFDEFIYNLVDKDVKQVIYSSIFKKVFTELGIYLDKGNVVFGDKFLSYSINERGAVSDIDIVVEKDGVVCTDSEKSLPFQEYFCCSDLKIKTLIDYAIQFEVAG